MIKASLPAVRLIVALIVGVLSFSCQRSSSPPSSGGDGLSASDEAIGFVKKSDASRVIVFVHGFVGDGKGTWTNPRTKAYWPKLIAEDSAFESSDVLVYSYETTALKENLSIDDLAENLRLRLESAGVFRKYQEAVFVAHSMGGVIVRNYLLKYSDRIKVPMVYFFATPTTGASLGNLASLIGESPQAEGLKKLEGNLFLQGQMNSWLASPLSRSVHSYCAFETKDTKGVRVVPRESATNLCNERLDPIGEDHINIVKPTSVSSDSYVAFKVAYEEVFKNQRLVAGAKDLVIDVSTPAPAWTSNTLVADKLLVKDLTMMMPNGGVIVANEIVLEGAASIKGKDATVVAGSISGGSIDASGGPGETAGRLTLATARLIGVRVKAAGGDGAGGAPGGGGDNGSDGGNGENGSCGAGMFGDFHGSTGGGDAGDGKPGGDGGAAGNGGRGGEVFLLTLNDPVISPEIQGGAGGKGGIGGRGGQGGRGGKGGAGCQGVGGSQPTRPDGHNGRDGSDGRPGADGSPGERGTIWARRIDRFGVISAVIPETSAIPDYADEIPERLRLLAKQR